MTFIRNLPLRTKLTVLIAVSILFLALTGALGSYYLYQMSHRSQDMYQERLLPVQWLNEFKTNTIDLETKVLQLTLETDEPRQANLETAYNELIAVNNNLLLRYQSMSLNAEQQQTYEDFMEELSKYRDIRGNVMRLARTDEDAKAYALYSVTLDIARTRFLEKLDQLVEMNEKSAEDMNADNIRNSGFVQKVTLGIMLTAVVLLGLMGVLINRLITVPIASLRQLMDRAAKGDLTGRGTYLYKDEIGSLTAYFNEMMLSLRSLVDRINENALTLSANSQELSAGAEQSARSSEEVATSSQHLAEEFESQTGYVEKAGAAVAMMSSGIEDLGQTSAQVEELARAAVEDSRNGYGSVTRINGQMGVIAEAVGQTQTIMDSLGERAEQIGNILSVMNEIATRTNLLALNAAIEAARAGEAGRGFAVVAEEVRKLASQSAESSGHISELIGLTVADIERAIASMNNGSAQVKEGLLLSEEVKQAFQKIEDSFGQVFVKLEESSSHTRRLMEGSAQMVEMMDKVNHVSQSGMAISEQTAAASQEQQATSEEIENASRSLAKLAEELQLALQRFTL